MDKQEIEVLAQYLADALRSEYEAKIEVVSVQAALDLLEADIVGRAQEAGKIDGKNADTRKAQRDAVVAASDEYRQRRVTLAEVEQLAQFAEIERRRVEAMVSLTKAWLYSQFGN